MSSVFYAFQERAQLYSCVGKENELMVVTRRGKTTSTTAMNNIRTALLKDDTKFSNGDIVTSLSNSNDKFFVVAKQSSTEATQAQLYRINTAITICKLTKGYVNGVFTGKYVEAVVSTDIPCYQRDVTTKMKEYDGGLLQDTSKKLLIPKNSVVLDDRIKIGTNNFRVTYINDSGFGGLFEVQVSVDLRA